MWGSAVDQLEGAQACADQLPILEKLAVKLARQTTGHCPGVNDRQVSNGSPGSSQQCHYSAFLPRPWWRRND